MNMGFDHDDLTSNNDRDHDHEMSINGESESEPFDFDIVGLGVPRENESTQKKLWWLRSQLIGGSSSGSGSGTVHFETPFGRRRLTYADHTASGRSLHYVENYIAAKVLPYYGNSHTSDSHVGYETTRMVHEATNHVKKCLGGGEEDAIIFCGSGSTAAIKRLQEVMGIVVPSLLRERMLEWLRIRDRDYEIERWVVLLGPYEHHSNILSWRQSLAEVVQIGLDHSGHMDMEDLTKYLNHYNLKKRPILGSFSACSNVTGIYTDTRAVARLLHHYGAFACFDFAASGPYAEIDMRSKEIDGYDAIFLSPHKFVGGPGTPGILLMSKALYLLGSSPPSTCGGGTVNYVNLHEKDTIYLDNIEEREDAGTPQIIQKIRAALVFSIKEYIGYNAIEKLEKSYVDRAMRRFLLNPNISILGNPNLKRQAIFSFLIHSSSPNKTSTSTSTSTRSIKPLNGSFVARLLNDLFGIQARGGCACAGPYAHNLLGLDDHQWLAIRSLIKTGYVEIRPGWTRVSFPYYMSEEEFEFILEAIEFIAMYGERFMWCYNFSWTKGSWTFNTTYNTNININININTNINVMVKAFEIDEGNEKQANIEEDDDHVLLQLRSNYFYQSYLETAKRIAKFLPTFPPQIKIPPQIDHVDLVPFRV